MSSTTQHHLPADRHYHPTNHIWAMGNNRADGAPILVGIDAMLLDNLGELAYIDLKPIGTHLKVGDSMGTLEAAKMTAEIFAPVSGRVIKTNALILERPLLVNESPYEAGWMIALEPDSWESESATLISGSAIAPWAEQEARRFEELPGSAQ